jgi:hypothetical protein
MPGDKKNLIFQSQKSCSKGESISHAVMNFSAVLERQPIA